MLCQPQGRRGRQAFEAKKCMSEINLARLITSKYFEKQFEKEVTLSPRHTLLLLFRIKTLQIR